LQIKLICDGGCRFSGGFVYGWRLEVVLEFVIWAVARRNEGPSGPYCFRERRFSEIFMIDFTKDDKKLQDDLYF